MEAIQSTLLKDIVISFRLIEDIKPVEGGHKTKLVFEPVVNGSNLTLVVDIPYPDLDKQLSISR